jgi:hypothetical protein
MKIFEFKKYSRKELATLYDKSSRSFQTWINPFEEEIGPRIGWDYTPAQVKIIVEHIGLPPGYYVPEILEKK